MNGVAAGWPTRSASSSGTIDEYQYGYDADGNALYRKNTVLTGNSELYTYDGLNRLTNFARGTLNTSNTSISGTASATASWNYDALGNWKNSSSGSMVTSRTNNAQNQATVVGGNTLAYDANGDMLTDQNGQKYKYDGWNRLVTVNNSAGTSTIASYKYDALGRMSSETHSGTTTDLYYSNRWQVIEEQSSGTTTTQYVYSPFYVDQMIERDTISGSIRLYVEQDANYNVTSLTNSSGGVVERYSYDPYGAVTIMNASGGVITASAYGWIILHQGLRLDNLTGLYYDRNRWYDPSLGRFVSEDPAGDVNGPDEYQGEMSSPVGSVDPSGTTAAEHKFWQHAVDDLSTQPQTDDTRKIIDDLNKLILLDSYKTLLENEKICISPEVLDQEKKLRDELDKLGINVNLATGFAVAGSNEVPADDVSSKLAAHVSVHTDVFYDGKVVRVGAGGDARRSSENVFEGQWYLKSKAQAWSLTKTASPLEAGAGKGIPGTQATDDQIIDSLAKYPVDHNPNGNTFGSNCNTDVENATTGSGLTGYVAPGPNLSGNKSAVQKAQPSPEPPRWVMPLMP